MAIFALLPDTCRDCEIISPAGSELLTPEFQVDPASS